MKSSKKVCLKSSDVFLWKYNLQLNHAVKKTVPWAPWKNGRLCVGSVRLKVKAPAISVRPVLLFSWREVLLKKNYGESEIFLSPFLASRLKVEHSCTSSFIVWWTFSFKLVLMCELDHFAHNHPRGHIFVRSFFVFFLRWCKLGNRVSWWVGFVGSGKIVVLPGRLLVMTKQHCESAFVVYLFLEQSVQQ